MPTICAFYGITIRMYYDDHNPPHYHVFYGNSAAKIAIHSGNVIAGALPSRILTMVSRWAEKNKFCLLDNWRRCQHHEPLQTLSPLE